MYCRIWIQLATIQVLLVSICAAFDLTILHTNDVHANVESFNGNSRTCSDEDIGKNRCYGGAARMTTEIKQIRRTDENVLLLDAGDQFQGSAWYTLLKWHPIAKIMNAQNYTAMALGNHEFDDWLTGLTPFMSTAHFPILSANIDSKSQDFMALLKKYIIIDVGGEKVGIVGYTTTEKGLFVMREPVVNFYAELPAVQQSVDQLREMGINKIIALGHSGFPIDKAICEQVEGVDVAVGGHDNTFLYTGEPPTEEVAEGPYPIVIEQKGGGKCLVVQDYKHGKFLGHLKVSFDNDGKLTNWSGNPILIDTSIQQDAGVTHLLQPYQQRLAGLKSEIIATAATTIDGTTTCEKGSCTAGSMIADAYRRAFLTKPPKYRGNWTRVNAAIQNTGGTRGAKFFEQGDEISMNDLYSMLPFQNMIQRYFLRGEHLLELLSDGLTKAEVFLQLSGIRAEVDLSRQLGKRIVAASILCTDCSPTRFVPIQSNKTYTICLQDYLVQAKVYESLSHARLDPSFGVLDIDAVRAYFEKFSPLEIIDDGRLSFSYSFENSGMTVEPLMLLFMLSAVLTLSCALLY